MKLSLKLYSPFFFILATVLFFSCNKSMPDNVDTSQAPLYNEKIYKAQTILDKSLQYFNASAYTDAFKGFLEVQKIYIAEKDYLRAGYSCYMMAEIQSKCGDYHGSQTTAVEALQYFKLSGNTDYIDSVYDVLGICYRKLMRYDNALESYNNARAYIEKPLDGYILDNNIASIYIDKKEYSTAVSILEKLQKSKIVNADSDVKARVLNNLGTVYFKLGNSNAIKYYTESLKIREAIKEPVGLMASYLKLSEYYKDKNKYTAKVYAEKAYILASKINNQEQKLDALLMLTKVTKGLDFEAYSNAYITENESNNIIKAKVKNEFAEMKYNYKEEQDKAAKNELKAQKDKLFLSVLAMLAGLVFVVSVFVNIIQRLKHKRAKMEEAFKAESRISKKIHDELANEVFEALMFTDSLQINDPEDKEVLLKRLDKVYEKTRDISRENNSLDTATDFYTLLIEMLARYKTKDVNVLAVNAETITWDVLNDYKKNTIYRVLQELMVNMKKHSQATLVVVKFNAESKKLHISYADNGIGIVKNNSFHKNGLENAESRIKSINGTIIFDDTIKGVKISIIMPL